MDLICIHIQFGYALMVFSICRVTALAKVSFDDSLIELDNLWSGYH